MSVRRMMESLDKLVKDEACGERTKSAMEELYDLDDDDVVCDECECKEKEEVREAVKIDAIRDMHDKKHSKRLGEGKKDVKAKYRECVAKRKALKEAPAKRVHK